LISGLQLVSYIAEVDKDVHLHVRIGQHLDFHFFVHLFDTIQEVDGVGGSDNFGADAELGLGSHDCLPFLRNSVLVLAESFED